MLRISAYTSSLRPANACHACTLWMCLLCVQVLDAVPSEAWSPGCLPFQGAEGSLDVKLPGSMAVAAVQLLVPGLAAGPDSQHACAQPHRLSLLGVPRRLPKGVGFMGHGL